MEELALAVMILTFKIESLSFIAYAESVFGQSGGPKFWGELLLPDQ